MIDFACKQFNLSDVVKCGLGLTKKEFEILEYFLNNPSRETTTSFLSKKLKLNLTTVQKAVKKLSENKIIKRHQNNLENGGYVFFYICNSKLKIRLILKEIIVKWSEKVKSEIDKW